MAASPSRIALVTGAGSGIGREVTLALLEAGWSVVLAGRNVDRLAETIARAGDAAAGRTMAYPADVSSPDAVDGLFAAIEARFGRLDLVFNNAGASGTGAAFADLTFAEWNRIVSVNLTGVFLCAQCAFRLMSRQAPRGGRIINNGSVSAQSPRPDSAAYTATKHAVTGLTKSLSLDGRAHGIACGQVDVGNAATTMSAGIKTGAKQADGSIAAEPMMDARDVARTVLLMASLPLEANIPFVTVMASAMPLVGRG